MKKIGKIVAVHGVLGDVTIVHQITNYKVIPSIESLMIEIWEDSFIPFFVESIKAFNPNEIILKFEEIHSREDAKKLLNKLVYVYKQDSVAVTQPENYEYLIGFKVNNANEVLVGIIKDIHGNGDQNYIELDYRGKTILLPLHQDLILKTDSQHKVITLEISEGLLDIY